MGEEVGTDSDHDGIGENAVDDEDDERVLEWEAGLPSADDLTPLSQPLIPPELASAFSISPEPSRTILDVHRASQSTVSSLRRQVSSNSSSASMKMFHCSTATADRDDPIVVEGDVAVAKDGISESESESKKVRLGDDVEDMDSAALMENSVDENSNSSRSSKKPRLVWTPQLHKRFVDVVAHLGLKNAVPKTIMQMMNVEGLTRENVASHLQKYRQYMRRMQGGSDEGPSSPENLYSSVASSHETPVRLPVPVPMQCPVPPPGILPMPVVGMTHHGHGGPTGMNMMPANGQPGAGPYGHFENHYPHPIFGERPREWPRGDRFGLIASHPRPRDNDKQ